MPPPTTAVRDRLALPCIYFYFTFRLVQYSRNTMLRNVASRAPRSATGLPRVFNGKKCGYLSTISNDMNLLPFDSLKCIHVPDLKKI